MVVPEMKSDSEEDPDDVVIASFIRTRSKPVVAPEPTPKRPTTQLQKNEALESALKKSQRSKRKRRLVNDIKAVSKKVVHVVDVDKEAEEEPSSLTYKSSKQKHSHSQSKGNICTSVKSPTKSVDAAPSEKFVERSGDKAVEKSGGESDDEEVENSGEHMHKKSMEKGKSIRKSVKRKVDYDEEPGTIKKAKVGKSMSYEKKKLRNQKVLWGRTFASDTVELVGMRQLVDICDFQQWTYLFANDVPKLYEVEV
ncbi:nucleolar protein 58-like [Nicotiana sylvestris]|uniref:nucleolar protein 58-like n=1 Tax=Nicotiana sylvestris TaxID=4096 RepID=UPI00388CD832